MAAADAGAGRWPRAVEAAPAAAGGAVRVFVLRGRRLVADAVIETLRGDRRLEVVGSAAAAGFVDTARLAAADVVLLDASDDRQAAIDCLRRLREAEPGIRVLAFGLGEAVEETIDFAEAGARACLALGTGFDSLAAAVLELHRRRTRCPPRLVASLIERIRRLERELGARQPTTEPALTERQREVLRLLVEGLTNKEIAQRMEIALATVKNHVHGLLARLGTHRRQDAVRAAYLAGVVDDFLPRRAEPRGWRRRAGGSDPRGGGRE